MKRSTPPKGRPKPHGVPRGRRPAIERCEQRPHAEARKAMRRLLRDLTLEQAA